MIKILILYNPNALGISDFQKTNYYELNERVISECKGKYPNFGNKVWLQGIVSEISTPENEITLEYEHISFDDINQNYDMVILPLANCFHKDWIPYLKKRAEYIRNIKIPVYVIACGAQADSYDDLNSLVEDTKQPATDFINAVYSTGGEFALRGFFTAEYFEKLGFHNAVVTGCPSIYQLGNSIKIPTEKVPVTQFNSAINGSFDLPIFDNDIDNSLFICQGTYGRYLYDNDAFNKEIFNTRRILKYYKRGQYSFVKALADDRIKLYCDINEWLNSFTINKISFSFGIRIHGTIMPILAGVPSMIMPIDTRTLEMAEFYNIPMFNSTDRKKYSLYELYCMTDYSAFNNSFAKKYSDFESFLKKYNIVSSINSENIYIQKNSDTELPSSLNSQHQKSLKKKLFFINPITTVISR